MARFKGIFLIFAVAIWANLYANEWLLSRENANRTAQMGPYNTPKIQRQIATNPAQNPSVNPNANPRVNAIRATNRVPNCNQKPQNCFIKRCTRQIPKQQATPQYPPQIRQKIAMPQPTFAPQNAPSHQRVAMQMPRQTQPQVQVPQQIQPQIQTRTKTQIQPAPQTAQQYLPPRIVPPAPQAESTTESKATPESAPKPQITPQANQKIESPHSTATAKASPSADSNIDCNELENPCGAYECIYSIGPCRKSEPKTQSKPQPKVWIDEMRLKDLPN